MLKQVGKARRAVKSAVNGCYWVQLCINVVGYLGPLTIAVAGGSNSLGRRHSCMIHYNIVV